MCVWGKSGYISSNAISTTPSQHHPFLHFAWVSWVFAPFPLTMNICSSLEFQTFLSSTFITKDSTDPFIAMRFLLRLDAIPPSAQETLSAHFGAPDKHTSIKSIFPHKGLQLPWWLVSGTDLQSLPLLFVSLYTSIKTVAAASPSLPEMISLESYWQWFFWVSWIIKKRCFNRQ